MTGKKYPAVCQRSHAAANASTGNFVRLFEDYFNFSPSRIMLTALPPLGWGGARRQTATLTWNINNSTSPGPSDENSAWWISNDWWHDRTKQNHPAGRSAALLQPVSIIPPGSSSPQSRMEVIKSECENRTGCLAAGILTIGDCA
jgi:hypothetical protein